ncbi:alpha/beta-hydrolase [Microthyrium microscopicum]|uniref:Carboxypeptidase n=1 Tax=Microthyrium microscopicum TaxID=703497 RepID=A0A6A6UJB9_9PEZI|nr:alpha/beta-hydrolase [Microthyrium microscopicum]
MLLQNTLYSVLLSLLVSNGVLASPFGRFGDINRRPKGGPSKVKQLLEREPQAKQQSTQFKYLSNATSAFQVKSMPDFSFDIGEMYSGLIPVKSGDTSKEVFFVFQPNVVNPNDKTLTIWLNGGPGCSSLEGFFQENGRFVWPPGYDAPFENPYAWTNLTNMLWVEHPIGVGFNKGTPTATTEEQVSSDFVGFLKNFETTFGIENYKIYVTGESYAGRYVPYVSAAVLNQKDKNYFDLGGSMMYDPCIGQYDTVQEDTVVVPFIKANQQFFPFSASQMSSLEKSHKSCGYDTYIDTYLQFPPPKKQPAIAASKSGCGLFNTAYNEISNINECFNVYDVNQTCPTPVDQLGDNPYFNRADVKAAFHAPSTTTWTECSNNNVFVGGYGRGPEGEGDLSADSIQKVLPQVLEATNRVIVGNGDYDMIIITNGTLLAIQNMTWNGDLGFQSKPATPVLLPDGSSGGVQHQERGLLWTESFKTGHMGPEYAPYIAYKQVQWLLGQIDTL